MTPGSSPEPSNESSKTGFKATIAKGIVGAVALAGTTAIPILVQRTLTPPTPATSPSPVVSSSPSVSPSPATNAATVLPATTDPQVVDRADDQEKSPGKSKKKKKD